MLKTTLENAFAQTPLFADKSWRLSPQPFLLSSEQHKEIEEIGSACVEFLLALERLYRRGVDGKRVLRNGELAVDWAIDYLDRGKPQDILDHGYHKSQANELPAVIRPDLLLTDKGFCLTEIDSVPGGIGLTAFLNGLYAGSASVIGTEEKMVDVFYQAVTGVPDLRKNPFVALIVSEEADTYRPEMEWLAAQLQRKGKRVFVFRPEDLLPLGDSVCVSLDGNPQKVDVIYRFWELFDLPNLSFRDFLFKVIEEGGIQVTPPMKHYHEEKLSLGLFHHPRLQLYWQESLSSKTRKILSRIVPKTWIVDPCPVSANAFLHAPEIGGQPIFEWQQMAEGSQKERNYILKLSGYHEKAWGARSVILGNDVSRQNWAMALHQAVREGEKDLYVLQEFQKPKRMEHPVYKEDGSVEIMQGRVRLCPYYLKGQENQYSLEGVLATVCPADKKIIHGMSDATLVPCARQS